MPALQIPQSFKVFGRTVYVQKSTDLALSDQALGISYSHRCRIILQAPSAVHCDEEVEQTFCHELVHTILDQIGEEEKSQDEKWVDLFGKALHQVLTTFSYTTEEDK